MCSVKRYKVRVHCADHGGFTASKDKELLESVRWVLRPGTVTSSNKGVIREYVFGAPYVSASQSYFSLSQLSRTGQSPVPPGTESTSHFVFVLCWVKLINIRVDQIYNDIRFQFFIKT